MLPHMAAGAGQAIEDAWILGRLLGDDRTTLSTLPSVLAVYEQVRKPIVQAIASRSTHAGQIASFCAPEQVAAGDAVRSPEALKRWADTIMRLRREVSDLPTPLQQWAQVEALLGGRRAAA
jgi:salicylate hydroxylase